MTGGTGQRWTVWRYRSQEQGKGGLCGGMGDRRNRAKVDCVEV